MKQSIVTHVSYSLHDSKMFSSVVSYFFLNRHTFLEYQRLRYDRLDHIRHHTNFLVSFSLKIKTK